MVTVTVNGIERTLDVDPETPLLYVLRNELGLVGTRFGCGTGLCGACVVIVDGRAVRSCDVPAGAVDGPVTTIEALGGAHPVQRALLEEQAGQCGYCLSGIVMSAKALLDAKPRPSDAEIRSALDGNICRCGSHPRILRAVRRVAGAGA
ncbi:MAG TPA: (2Fe-2S)-binding protein [Candidatus Limnocylindria bacterium]|nr:(2Fe-2S)-binding protein [Candidatus Limnocylindria bacterium]